MLTLTSELDTRSFLLFMRCDEFNNTQALRTVFVTTDLAPFVNSLPENPGDKKAFVNVVKLFLLEKYLADGRVLLLPFLNTLRGRYPEQDALHGELDDLHQRVLSHMRAILPPPVIPAASPLSLNHHYICYAPQEGYDHAERLHAALQLAGARPWLDRRAPASHDPEALREEALRECASVLLVLTPASANVQSDSAGEWRKALQFKKPIIPLRFAPGAELPLMLGHRTVLDFTGPFEQALSELRRYLEDLASLAGNLRELEYRLADAERELRTASGNQRPRIEQDMQVLQEQIEAQRAVARDPQGAARAAEQRTEAALQLQRQPERPSIGHVQGKFINPPPLIAPNYFQDRHNENGLIAEFLRDPALCLLTLVGRGGVGKTALVCRLLKALEAGHLPDDLGELRVGGIVYLSAVGSRRVSFPNLHADLLHLLPVERAQPLAALYQNPQKSVADKLTAVLNSFAEAMPVPVVVLLDNVEDLLDSVTQVLTDVEVDAALRALLEAPPHPAKVLLTTRVAPREILLLHPERQMTVPLDEGLPSPFAERILRAGDPTGVLGLKEASDERLAPAREFTRGYPRALEALTAALNADRATTLEDLLAGPPPANVVEVLVGQAYSRLDPTAQKVMQALAVFGRPVPPAAVDYLLQPRLPSLDSTPVLNRLVNMRFVTKETGRYYMHPVDRTYALQRLTLEPSIADLQTRAADYFRETRTPSSDWQTLADLAPQLAEIDMRYAAGDYDTVAELLLEIDFDYLLRWGHCQLMIDQHERLQGKVRAENLKENSVGNLGSAYYRVGQLQKAISCYEQALSLARECDDQVGETVWSGNLAAGFGELGQTQRAMEDFRHALDVARGLGRADLEASHINNMGFYMVDIGDYSGALECHRQALTLSQQIGDRQGSSMYSANLGIRYHDQGETEKALEYCRQSLALAQEIRHRYSESVSLTYLGDIYLDQGMWDRAIEHYELALQITDEINNPQFRNLAEWGLAFTQLSTGNLTLAGFFIEEARKHEVPRTNHAVWSLAGVISLRSGNRNEARKAFATAIAEADSLLAHNDRNSRALDSRALALCGLTLCEMSGRYLPDASKAYSAAREMTSDAGIVSRVLLLFDVLAQADTGGILADIRPTAAGVRLE